jgi:hypothetical protein
VAKQSAEANIVAEKVSIEEAVVGKQAAETAAVAADAQKEAIQKAEARIYEMGKLTDPTDF